MLQQINSGCKTVTFELGRQGRQECPRGTVKKKVKVVALLKNRERGILWDGLYLPQLCFDGGEGVGKKMLMYSFLLLMKQIYIATHG